MRGGWRRLLVGLFQSEAPLLSLSFPLSVPLFLPPSLFCFLLCIYSVILLESLPLASKGSVETKPLARPTHSTFCAFGIIRAPLKN